MNPVASLALATIAFVGTHLAMSHPLRAGLVARLGERGFMIAYSSVSFATLGWMIWAWRSVEGSQPLWIAPLWWFHTCAGLMLIASILLVGSLRGNPAFPNPGGGQQPIGEPKGVFAITRHPMNVSFTLWALGHLSFWGSPRNLIVAGGILILAVAGSIGQDAKKTRLLGEPWRDWRARTSFVPFAALIARVAPWRAAWPGWFALIGGILLWLAVGYFHFPFAAPISSIDPGIN